MVTVTTISRAVAKLALAATIHGALAMPALAETPGRDGDLTVASSTVLNQYAAISGSPSAGAPSLTLAAPITGLARGDLVLVYQAQGAAVSSADTSGYGAVTALGGAGLWEFQTVASVSGLTVTFATYGGACGGLVNSYSAAGRPQLIRVPQYRNLTIAGGVSVTAQPWNGTTGGVAALHVSQTLTNNGAIAADGAGFRGGAVDNLSVASTAETLIWRASAATAGGEKGESVAGFQTDYDALGGRYGRGAPANGGGGGNGHNAGGGGGANGNNGAPWAGLGVPNTAPAGWTTAWNLDPALNSATSNSGGGRGGYTFANSNQNALTLAPGAAAWGGNSRREVGGRGGRPLPFAANQRAFLGGGGGAGDGNNNAAGAGGRGGGLIFLLGQTLTGAGQVRANGAQAANTLPAHNDAPGGGGAGGTIVTVMASVGGVSFQANGGAGGSQLITSTESEGPGGGGGGGVIAASGGTRIANGGANGLTNSSAMTEFTANGATQGAAGQPNVLAPAAGTIPFCSAPTTPLSVAKTSVPVESTGDNRFALPGADVFYDINITNPANFIDNGSLIIIDPLPLEVDFLNADIDGAGPATTPVAFTDGPVASELVCCNAGQIAYSQFASGTDFSYVPVAGYDPNVRRIRVTPSGSMAAALLGATSFQLRFRARIK